MDFRIYFVHFYTGRAPWEDISVQEFLSDLQLDLYYETFDREQITMDVLVEMTHDDLQSVGITAFGHRHKIIRKARELVHSGEVEPAEPVGVASAKHMGTQLIELSSSDREFIAVSDEVWILLHAYSYSIVCSVTWGSNEGKVKFCYVFRCRILFVNIEMMEKLVGGSDHMKLLRYMLVHCISLDLHVVCGCVMYAY